MTPAERAAAEAAAVALLRAAADRARLIPLGQPIPRPIWPTGHSIPTQEGEA